MEEFSPTMENNSRECPICNKSFSNGKALGGHMKSHLAKLPIPPKPTINNQVSISKPSSSTSHQRNNPIHNLRSLKRSFYFTLANFGRFSPFESYPKTPTRKRSKRIPKRYNVVEKKEENTQWKLVYDDFDMEVAETLAIIRAKEWQQIEEKYYKDKTTFIERENKSTIIRAKEWQQIEEKYFKDKTTLVEREIKDDVVNEEVHKCTYCSEKFDSHQLLEEHKKVHLSNSSVSNPQLLETVEIETEIDTEI